MPSTAIVAGGSAGIGRAVSEALIRRGYRVGVIARGRARLSEMEAEFGPDTCCARAADVSDAAALDAAAGEIVAHLGAPDVWVNAAMLTSFSPFEQVAADEFQRIVDVTLIGQVNGIRTALRLMQSGRIVNIGSGLAYRPVPFQAAYCAAKHGINGVTGSVRSELIRQGRDVSLSLVQLPAVNTPQFDWALNRLECKPQPAPPIYSPRAAARGVMHAIDTGAREIILGKSAIKLVLGTMILPNWLDRKMAESGASLQKSDEPEPGGRPDNLSGPVDGPSRAEGRFSDRASDRVLIVDGDRLRKVVFLGLPAALFVLGVGLGVVIGMA